MFLVLFLLVSLAALAGLLALDARLSRGRGLAGPSGMPATFDRPELHGRSRARVS